MFSGDNGPLSISEILWGVLAIPPALGRLLGCPGVRELHVKQLSAVRQAKCLIELHVLDWDLITVG